MTSLDAVARENSWWQRESGGSEVLRVALPLVISSLSWTVMTFVDRVFLQWVSGTAMAAAFSASVAWFCVICLPLGICAYTNTFVSQYWGDRRRERIGPSIWQGVWVALAFTPLVLLMIPLAPVIFRWAGHSPEAFTLETTYFQILLCGGPAMLIGQALAAFYSGRGMTRVVMWVDASFAILNLVLDYVWIFGHAGFPAMGIVGAGWATVLSLWLKASMYLFLVMQPRYRAEFGTLTGLRIDRALFGRLLYFGGPSGIQMLLDLIGFTVFVMLIGRLGDLEYQATSMAFSISTLGFMPIHGISLAVSILVGHRLGEDRPDLAERATWTSLVIAASYMAALSLVYLLAPGVFLYWFFAGVDPAHPTTQQVWQLSATLLCFVAAYNLLDATMMVFVSALKGAGDTRYVLIVSLSMTLLLAGLSWLAVEVFSSGIYGCWCLITGWIWVMGVLYWRRFQSGKWREMRVIERRGEVSLPPPAAELVAVE